MAATLQPFSRRRFLYLAGLATLSGLGDRGTSLWATGTATSLKSEGFPRVSVTVDAETLVAGGLENLVVGADGIRPRPASEGRGESAVLKAPILFSALGVHWRQTSSGDVYVAVKISSDGETWSGWQPLDRQTSGREERANQVFGNVLGLFEPPAQYAQLQLRLVADPDAIPVISEVSLVFMDSIAGATAAEALARSGFVQHDLSVASATKPPVITRSAWGCPDGQSSPRWAPQYQTVTNVIIHHTATASDQTNWPAVVRAIWSYHTFDRGWGDIGYNYLVDPNGYLYEGRAGGDDVIAGHTYGFNNGTMGLAFTGTYQSSPPSRASIASAQRLIAWKMSSRCIDPHGQNAYAAYASCPTKLYVIPRLLGHRDAPGHATSNVCNTYGTTSCPGTALSEALPSIRSGIASLIGSPPTGPTISKLSFSPTHLVTGGLLRVEVTVFNGGCSALPSQGPASGFVYDEGDSFEVLGYSSVPGAFRVGVDLLGPPQSFAHPYRWGWAGSLAPGASATVTGFIRLRKAATADYWVGLVEESVRWWLDRASPTTIIVSMPPSVAIDPVSTTKTWFVLSWRGSGGIGSLSYTVEFRRGGSIWRSWLSAATATRALFAGEANQGYTFRVVATDGAGNSSQTTQLAVETGFDSSGLNSLSLPSVIKDR